MFSRRSFALFTTMAGLAFAFASHRRSLSSASAVSSRRPGPFKKLAIIGDVHGCIDELDELLAKLDDRQVVFVGDLVRKGPDSKRVVHRAIRIGALTVKGNHDFYALKDGKNKLDLSKEELDYLRSAPVFLRFRELNLIVVHAGLLPAVAPEAQNPMDLMTMRNIDDAGKPTTSHKDGVPWVNQWTGPEHVVFGHDAKRGLQRGSLYTGLDTGCVYGGKLTALLVPEMRLVHVDAHKEYKPRTTTAAAVS